MIITKKALPRRTMLRGLGTAMALPLLDGMVPALTALSRTEARAKPRLGVVYVPHGAVMNNWTPVAEGAGFEFTPILQPLSAYRDRLTVLSGLDHVPGAQMPGDPAGGHGRITGAFLTGVHAKPTEGADFEAGRSMDQIAAATLGQQTQLGVLGSRYRVARVWRCVRRRIQLRLYQHAQLEHAHHAATDGEQPPPSL